MNDEENIQPVQQAYQLFETGDLNSLLDLYPEDIEFVFPGPAALVPLSGTFRGKEQVTRFFVRLYEHVQFDLFEPREFLAQGARVVALGHNKGSIRMTGKAFEEDWAHVYTMRAGKIHRCQIFLDTYTLAAVFSPDPPPQADSLPA